MKIKLIIFLFYFCETVLSNSSGSLYGISRLSIKSSFVKIENDYSKIDNLVDLGRISISCPSTATKSFDNKNYLLTYHTFDSFGVPYYYILTIDTNNPTKLISNISLNGPGLGSFWQINDENEKQLIGIRESMHAGSTLEVASINKTNGFMKSIGYYPYGSYSIVMTYAKQRRLYYNIIDSYLFCGINIDTGSLDIKINIPNDYLIYAIIYDSIKDRLISIVHSPNFILNHWVLANIIIEKDSSNIKFERIGNSSIEMFKEYYWSTTYTLALNQRQLITLWDGSDRGNTLIIHFDIDTGDIVLNKTIHNSQDLNNIVYFD